MLSERDLENLAKIKSNPGADENFATGDEAKLARQAGFVRWLLENRSKFSDHNLSGPEPDSPAIGEALNIVNDHSRRGEKIWEPLGIKSREDFLSYLNNLRERLSGKITTDPAAKNEKVPLYQGVAEGISGNGAEFIMERSFETYFPKDHALERVKIKHHGSSQNPVGVELDILETKRAGTHTRYRIVLYKNGKTIIDTDYKKTAGSVWELNKAHFCFGSPEGDQTGFGVDEAIAVLANVSEVYLTDY